MTETPTAPDSPTVTREQGILDLCAAMKPGGTINPSDAAQAFADSRGEGPLGWRTHLHHVRDAAIRLAESGRIVIYRKGKPADPEDFRGVWRMGLPHGE